MTCCHECQLPLHEGDPVREVVDEEHGELVRHPVHLDCRLALAREYAGLVRGLMVELMRRRKDFGSGRSLRPHCLSPAEAPEEPALLSPLQVAS